MCSKRKLKRNGSGRKKMIPDGNTEWRQKWRLIEMVNMLGRLNEKNQNIMDLEYAQNYNEYKPKKATESKCI